MSYVLSMTLTDDQTRRLAALRQEFCPGSLVTELSGIDLLTNEPLWGRYQSWLLRTRARSLAGQETQEWVNRHWWEIFLQRENIVPTKVAAARLGMTKDSLNGLHAGLALKGLLDLEHDRDEDIVGEQFLKGLPGAFDATRNRIFANHDDYCGRLHQAASDELGVVVEPLRCATASILGQPWLAASFDAITLEPVSLPYEVWLDTGKPMSLKPDTCGLVTYVRNETLLAPMGFGGRGPHQLDPGETGDLRTRLTEAA
jgi:hypothetical protein